MTRAVLNPVGGTRGGAGPLKGEAMTEKGDAAKAVTRNLHAAIERVREDVAKVEFWADAVTGFTQPVPEYRPSDVNIWLPPEQAKNLGSRQSASVDDPPVKKPIGET